MTATCEVKVYTGTDAGTENPTSGDADNMNLMSADSYDSDGTQYQSYPISVPDSGTNYSYERWVRLKFSNTFNKIENIKAWKSSGTLSDSNLDIKAGTTTTGATPTNSQSTIATTSLTSWDSESEALDLTPSGGITSSPGYSKYLVMQLVVPSTVTTPGDVGTIVVTFRYDES